MKEGRDKNGRFAKGNKIGFRLNSNGKAAEYGARGGKKSAPAIAAFKTMYERAKELSSITKAIGKDGKLYDMLDVAIKEQLERAAKGDTAAYMAIMKTLREDVQRVEVEAPPVIVEYVEQDEQLLTGTANKE